MTENALRETIERNETAFGVLDGLYSPTLVELAGDLGFDFVWIDYEHGGPSPWDSTHLENLLRAADATDTELLVRIPKSDPALVRKVLDAGARNVFVSRVETAAEVERVVEAARFEYDDEPGKRGMASPRSSRWGGLGADYADIADESVLVGVTIETASAVENVEDVLDVPELGFVFLGPHDLAVAHGHPGEPQHDTVQADVDAVVDAARNADVPYGGLAFGVEDAAEKADAGYQLLNVGSTVGAVRNQLGSWHQNYAEQRTDD